MNIGYYIFVSYEFSIRSTPKLSNYIILLPFTYKAIQWVPIDLLIDLCPIHFFR